jgi:hypothetical protein
MLANVTRYAVLLIDDTYMYMYVQCHVASPIIECLHIQYTCTCSVVVQLLLIQDSLCTHTLWSKPQQ